MTTSYGYFFISFFLGFVIVVPYILWLQRLGPKQLCQAAAIGLVVAAVIYIGFSLFNADRSWVMVEVLGVLAYGLAAWLAIRYSLLWLAAGWGLHPIWDVWLHWLGPGSDIVPPWYAIACLSFDVALGVFVIWIWKQQSISGEKKI